MRNFIVEVPTRGVQMFLVKADSAAEADRMVRSWMNGDESNIRDKFNEGEDDPVRPFGHEVTWSGQPRWPTVDGR